MSRLYDRIMRSNIDSEFKNILQGAEVIFASNVAEYVFSLVQERGHGFGINDLVNVRPPFTKTFIEWSDTLKPLHMNRYVSHSEGYLLDVLPADWNNNRASDLLTEEPYAIVTALNIFETNGVITPPQVFQMFGVTEMGEMVESRSGGLHANYMPNSYLKNDIEKRKYGDDTEYLLNDFLSGVFVALATINFMHCKNVEQIEETPPPKLSAKHEKKYGVPLVKYKVLKVNSMRREYADDDRESQPGIPKSLHICRGHFKDYRNGGGLFGKLEGIYWWDQYVRGDAKRGIVIKDYDVQAPKDED